MPPRNNREERNHTVEVADGDTYCTVTLQGDPEYTQLIYDAIMGVARVRLLIGQRGTKLTPSRDDPDLLGVRYLNIITHKTDLPQK